MLGIQCRDYFRRTHSTVYSLEGLQAYEHALAHFKVGPVMIHHTYANMLTEETKQPEKALPHRRIALRLEKAPWTYQGLANTLTALGQYEEANRTFKQLVELCPRDPDYLESWTLSLMKQKNWQQAADLCEKIVQLDPGNAKAFYRWGECLEVQYNFPIALQKYMAAIALNPADANAYTSAANLLMIMRREQEALQLLAQRDLTKTEAPSPPLSSPRTRGLAGD